jgi:hypothetical protein
MKARFFFYCAAVIALVLILAAAPSHATERRDPIQTPNSSQNSGSGHPDGAATHAQGSSHTKKAPHAARSAHVNPTDAKVKPAVKKNANDAQMGTSSGTK